MATNAPNLVENKGLKYTVGNNQTNAEQVDYILDENWVRHSFLISDDHLTDIADKQNRYFSSASFKFTDTRLGANIGINPRPQFTRYADIRVKGRMGKYRNEVNLSATTGNFGMGRYYSEAIDDPAQIIYLRFGVPQFSSLTSFLTRAFDADTASLAKTGRAKSIFYDLGRVAGTIGAISVFPVAAPIILAGQITGKLASLIFGGTNSKYYTLKPTMHLYWSTVSSLVNAIAVKKGIMPKVFNDEKDIKLGKPFKINQEYLTELSRLMPEIFKGDEDNVFDMYAIANRGQRLANKLTSQEFEDLNNGTTTNYFGYLKDELTGSGSHSTEIVERNGDVPLFTRLNEILKFGYYKAENTLSDSASVESDPRSETLDKDNNKVPKDPTWMQQFFTHFDSELRDGASFAVFRVDSTGSVSESFSNSVGESDMSQKLNSLSSDIRQARFSFAEGNVLGDTVQSMVGAAIDVGQGLLAGATFNFSNLIFGLAGTGYLDIPKYWQSSSASLPRSNYTIQLVSPYGNPISQLQNIYIPLAMLLAGALPLSTGKQSYTSPFICQLFDRGRCQIRLGMIESLSITRGTTNLPFNNKGAAMSIDVNFSIVDLSSIMHMPISDGSVFGNNMTMDDDNILSDYISVLAGQDLYSQLYLIPKAKLRIAQMYAEASKVTSPAYWSSWFHESATSGVMQYLTLGTVNVIEAVNRGSSTVTIAP